ncbi:Ribosomal RNA small subunit methyltransferase E [Syntrophobotulus glycolicus DSM 8271]|uniref:Ribosomal RNA small subunit methyltransferase E n=1 Tax=Syntrophobotulus glycolicus (strain DSM 8271 / FlGlyR) TaxID=645991 RepID=F0SVE6_SYNGF|nr:RsmE family RNA methyltransferase [Syntrophobotulus glycolicus]ADY56719.1 Ribosomal RNA small subunit methyltransferase E [Syntrophobotulus glycolicus DSM 8271]
MHRFRISSIDQDYFLIDGEELHHLTRVLRLGPGEEILGFDHSGRLWRGAIREINKEQAVCSVIRAEIPETEAKVKVYLIVGLSKGEKMELVIQKGTELGMTGLIPLRTRRSVMKLEGTKAEERVDRWRKIAGEAVKQCGRVIQPAVAPVLDWQDLPAYLPADTQWLIPFEGEKTVSLKACLKSFDPSLPMALIIGPEGGFEPQEVLWAKEKLGAKSISLGSRILRAETAAIAALTIVLAFYGDLG